MNKFWKYVLLNIGIVYAISALAGLAAADKTTFEFVPLILGALELPLAVLFVIIPATRFVGKVMLLSSGLVLLIGLSICSLFPVNFNVH